MRKQRTDAEVIRDHEQRLHLRKKLQAEIRRGKLGTGGKKAAILRALTTPLTDKQREQGRGA